MKKIDYVKKSLPLFYKDFDKFFEVTEYVCPTPTYPPTGLLIKPKNGKVVNAWWLREIMENYSCMVTPEGLVILSLRKFANWIKIFDIKIEK